MADTKKPSELANELLKLIKENAKPIVKRSGGSKIELIVQGKAFTFEAASRNDKRRKDISS